MPYQDLHKKLGVVNKSTLAPEETLIIKNYDDMFGHAHWQELVKDQGRAAYSTFELKLMN
jgi:hypothetical protein